MSQRRAFTLIEMLVVIVIIAIIAAVLLPLTQPPKDMLVTVDSVSATDDSIDSAVFTDSGRFLCSDDRVLGEIISLKSRPQIFTYRGGVEKRVIGTRAASSEPSSFPAEASR